MEYPGTKFTRPWRKLIFWLFVTAFFIISPLVVLSTIGYRYDWQQGLVKITGAISIDIEPADAQIFIDHTLITTSMPLRLKNVIPQKYTIRITKDGYYDWQKEIQVKEKQTIYIKEIQLLKKEKVTRVVDRAVDILALSPNFTYLAYTVHTPLENEIWVRNNTTQETKIIMHTGTSTPITLTWDPSSVFLAVHSATPPFSRLTIVRADSGVLVKNISSPTTTPVTRFVWKQNASTPELYFSTTSTISSFIPNTLLTTRITTNTYGDWQMENEQLWGLAATSSPAHSFVITKDVINFPSIFAVAGPYVSTTSPQFLEAARGQALLSHPDLHNLELITAHNKFTVNANNYIISPFNHWWIFWTPWELTTYSEGEEPMLLNRSGEQLRQVIPLDKFNTLALITAQKVTVLFPYYLVNHDLLTGDFSSGAANTDAHLLYLSGKINNEAGVWELYY